MRRSPAHVLIGRLLAGGLALAGFPALAATPAFTLAATSVTMSSSTSSGQGSSSFTLTSINGYAGLVGINCSAPTPPMGVLVPICDFGGPAYPQIESLSANQAATGTILFRNSLPPCNPCPVSLPRHRRNHGLSPDLALAAALLFGFGFRRRAARGLTLALLALGVLAGLAGISACGGNSNNRNVSPGTYVYTINARDMNSNALVSTSVNVTVP
jgi:hypothetical protein